MTTFTPRVWSNGAPPAISASNLQAIDDGIQNSHIELQAHLDDTVDSHDASAISNVAAGNIVATDVQTAINELDTEKVAKAGDTMTGDLTFSGAQKIIGGTGTTSDLTLQTTSGIGASGADMHFLVGNNGATEAITILNAGTVGIGTTAAAAKLAINGGLNVGADTDPGDNNLSVAGTSALIGAVTASSTVAVTGILTAQVGAVINETGADSDTRIEGDTNANLFKVDASADTVLIGDGGTTNYTKFASDGQRTYYGTAQALTEISFITGTEGHGIRLPTTLPASFATYGDANGEIGTCDFADAATSYLDLSFKMPGNYVASSNVTVELLWMANANTGNIVWGAAFSAVANGEAVNPALSAFTTGTFTTAGTAYLLNTHSVVLSAPAIVAEDWVTIRLERVGADGSDTLAATAQLLNANIQFLVSS